MASNLSEFIFVPPVHGAIDPLAAVARFARPELPKRFYAEVAVAPRAGGFGLLLDGRGVKTPTRIDLLLPDARLADLVAQEWAAQGERIDPATMPLTRLANSAICGVADNMAATLDDALSYAGSDLVCYRAGSPRELVELQAAHWDPMLAWARDTLGARFVLVEGMVHAAQPLAALAAVRLEAERLVGEGASAPFRLAALHIMVTLTGSALLALQCAFGALALADAWRAAHVDEDYEISLWGEDFEAQARRAARWRDFAAAGSVLFPA